MVYSAYTVGMEFTSIPTDKWEWHPSPLPSQITLVTSRGADGALDLAPKSCLAVMAFDPLTVGFACNRGHTTYQNIVRTGEFVVNVLPEGLAPLAWAIIAFQGQERIDASGLTFLESKRVAVPRIAECTAHLECEFDDAVAFESGEVFVASWPPTSSPRPSEPGSAATVCSIRASTSTADGLGWARPSARRLSRVQANRPSSRERVWTACSSIHRATASGVSLRASGQESKNLRDPTRSPWRSTA